MNVALKTNKGGSKEMATMPLFLVDCIYVVSFVLEYIGENGLVL